MTMKTTRIEVRAKTERGYRALGVYFPAIEWTAVDATDADMAALSEEPVQFIEFRTVVEAEPSAKKK